MCFDDSNALLTPKIWRATTISLGVYLVVVVALCLTMEHVSYGLLSVSLAFAIVAVLHVRNGAIYVASHIIVHSNSPTMFWMFVCSHITFAIIFLILSLNIT